MCIEVLLTTLPISEADSRLVKVVENREEGEGSI